MAGPAACPRPVAIGARQPQKGLIGPGSTQLFLFSRPPALILIAAPFSSRLSVCCRDLPKGGRNDLTVVSQSCVKDEGGPLGIGFQEQVSNQSELLR